MDADVPVVESGGKTDFQYGSVADALYPPTNVDRTLHDGDEVKLGRRSPRRASDARSHKGLHDVDDEREGRR